MAQPERGQQPREAADAELAIRRPVRGAIDRAVDCAIDCAVDRAIERAVRAVEPARVEEVEVQRAQDDRQPVQDDHHEEAGEGQRGHGERDGEEVLH